MAKMHEIEELDCPDTVEMQIGVFRQAVPGGWNYLYFKVKGLGGGQDELIFVSAAFAPDPMAAHVQIDQGGHDD